MSGTDANGDPTQLRIVTLPGIGALYQCDGGARGTMISAVNTMVTDPAGRVVFVPALNGFGFPYASFQYLANDGLADSTTATVTVTIDGKAYGVTQPATQVTGASATLNGMVLASGLAARAWFEWGTNLAYGNQTVPVDLNVGSNVVRVTDAIGGLTVGMTYHFRLVATNGAGAAYGANQMFAVGKKLGAWGYNFYGQVKVPVGLVNVVTVAGGDTHSLALQANGTVKAWGNNNGGQTNVPVGLSNVVAIAGGYYHSLALLADGTVKAWGDDSYGQTNVPVGLSNVVAIAGGFYHSLAASKDGSVKAWGYNNYGQTTVPVGLSNVVAIAGGYYHSLALLADGSVKAWGRNNYGQTNVPVGLSNVVAIAGGYYHSLALQADGTVKAWGDNSYGQTNVPVGLSNVVTIAGGGYHSLALLADGSVKAWGYNKYGQTNVPAGLSNVVAIAGGGFHSLILGGNVPPVAASLSVSGPRNRDLLIALSGTDLNGDPTQLRIVTLPGIGALYQCDGGARGTMISAVNTMVTDPTGRVVFVPTLNGFGFPYASFQYLANDGLADSPPAMVTVSIDRPYLAYVMTQPATQVTGTSATLNGMVTVNKGLASRAWFEWGTNTVYGNQTAPVDLGTGSNVVRVTDAIGGLTVGMTYHFRLAATNAEGAAYGADQMFAVGKKLGAWGGNTYGQTKVPVGLSNVVAIAGGGYHSLALQADGMVKAWGNNNSGQTNVPVGLSNVVAIAGGASHSLALQANGTVKAWGNNSDGQTTVPVGLSNVVAIVGGGFHSLALQANGTVKAWGYNNSGQTTVPVGLSNVVAIAGGFYHSLALLPDGTVKAWGKSNYGQTNVPIGLSNVVAIAGGDYHSLALLADGSVKAWGYNSDGQTTMPVELSNVVAIAGGAAHSLALGGNVPPVAASQSIFGRVNSELLITLSGTDANGDLLQFRISLLAGVGTLYQCSSGSRGTVISATNTVVTDPANQVVFVPATNGYGSPYDNFAVVASDGQSESAPAVVTVGIWPPVPASFTSCSISPNGSFQLTFQGATNTPYDIWVSTNLMDWKMLGLATQTEMGWFRYEDVPATNYPQRFYRAVTK